MPDAPSDQFSIPSPDWRSLAYFREQRGEHFDPALVDIFFENVEGILRIREQYSDKYTAE